jgi:hypothetical protein
MLHRQLAGFVVIRKTEMSASRSRHRYRSFILVLLGCALAACSALPRIGGQNLPPDTAQATPLVYRDLADIPDPPPISAPETNEAAIQALAAEREKAAEAAEALRRQPFTMPDPATPPGP